MPKVKILARLATDRIPAAVPPDYRDRVRQVAKAGLVYYDKPSDVDKT